MSHVTSKYRIVTGFVMVVYLYSYFVYLTTPSPTQISNYARGEIYSFLWVMQRRLIVTDVSGQPAVLKGQTAWPLKMGLRDFPETSLTANVRRVTPPEWRRSHLYLGGESEMAYARVGHNAAWARHSCRSHVWTTLTRDIQVLLSAHDAGCERRYKRFHAEEGQINCRQIRRYCCVLLYQCADLTWVVSSSWPPLNREFGGMQSLRDPDTSTGGTGKGHEKSLGSFAAEIWTRDLADAGQDCCPLSF